MITRRWLLGSAMTAAIVAVARAAGSPTTPSEETFAVTHDESEWRSRLTPEQFSVLRRADTERPFTSTLLHEKRNGLYLCAGCDNALFSSKTKFDSGTGWPSFWAPLDKGVSTKTDTLLGMVRTEVHCHRCGGHLGHVFDDGPQPTGLRYCMNGVALSFQPSAR